VTEGQRRARWIWSEADGPPNTWMCFRKRFGLRSRPRSAPARIAADTKYWLWLNGRLVVREGGLKRGPTPDDTYCDEVDLAPHLRRGENVIAVLVWYWGKHSYSHRDSGRGGLVLDSRAVVTDGTWTCRAHPAFKRTRSKTSVQLAPWSIRYDARDAIDGWEQADYDDSDWTAATAKGRPPVEPWGRLVRRPIPFWRDAGLKPYVNARDLPRRITVRKGRVTTVTARLPYNCQMTPALEVDAPAGVTVTIDTDCCRRGNLWAKYVTRKGVQAWESPGWLNGETVRYRFSGTPGAVRIRRLQYRETGIDADFAGSFTSDDEALNTLWRKAARTTYLCIRDNYMDCPDRERAQWWGDAVNEILQTFYCLAPAAHASIRKGVLEIVNWQRPDGVLFSPVPQGTWGKELPTQMLAGTWVMWQSYRYTGDAETLRAAYPAVKRYIAVWEKRNDRHGLVVPKGDWLWVDWGEEPKDGYRVANALYVLVLRSAARMAGVAGRPTDAKRYDRMAGRQAALCRERLWEKTSYGTDERANALCVLAGFVDAGRDPHAGPLPGRERGTASPSPLWGEGIQRGAAGVIDVLFRTRRCSPYMERYVLEALCCLGREDLAIERMKARYNAMIRSRWTTLWEVFARKWSTNHAWSGGPLYVLSAYVAGIRPIEPGFATYLVAPQPGPLTRIAATVPTVRGLIRVDMRCEQGRAVRFRLTSPKGTRAHVALPVAGVANPTVTVGGRAAWRDGRPTRRVPGMTFKPAGGGCLLFTAAPGTYAIRIRP